jgi:hypothetical protein
LLRVIVAFISFEAIMPLIGLAVGTPLPTAVTTNLPGADR